MNNFEVAKVMSAADMQADMCEKLDMILSHN